MRVGDGSDRRRQRDSPAGTGVFATGVVVKAGSAVRPGCSGAGEGRGAAIWVNENPSGQCGRAR